MSHHSATTAYEVTTVPANENGRGNLAGFRVECRECGFAFTTAFESTAHADGREHIAFMARYERKGRGR